ncbi:hypothetical protein SAY86_011887 [Trapa natans]|uniref:GATA-type domain-containing protein n=1 Tax=Trapa natans TaxID=22666 RepID=A0AAN7RCC9_TRANT|nr:hypothetical protein SAY86_011887 [Trapa natans]
MDWRGMSTAEHVFRIEDLLDLSNDELFSACAASDSYLASSTAHLQPPLPTLSPYTSGFPTAGSSLAASLLTDELSFPLVQSDDVEELEWLSRFVEDSFSDIPTDSFTGSPEPRPEGTFSSEPLSPVEKLEDGSKATAGGGAEAEAAVERRCTHCASERTPQWRTGPEGPKTLCNACGVRYKSGRLVPEYRPASSPTFVLTQHSNSHRKVMELRRQKELRPQE